MTILSRRGPAPRRRSSERVPDRDAPRGRTAQAGEPLAGLAPRPTRRLRAEIPDRDRHLNDFARHFADPEVAAWHWPQHLGGPRTRGQALEMLEAYAGSLHGGGLGFWCWYGLADCPDPDIAGRYVGQVGLNPTEIELDARAGGKARVEAVVEVGWSISPGLWGRGLAVEAAAAALAWGFEQAGLDEIVAFTLAGNTASRRVMEKLGMAYDQPFSRKGFPQVLYRLPRPA